MALCPFTQQECPEHNKKGGCQLWLDTTVQGANVQSSLSGCAMALGVLLQAHSVNNTAALADGVNKVQAEISHARVEQLQFQNRERVLRAALSNPIELNEER